MVIDPLLESRIQKILHTYSLDSVTLFRLAQMFEFYGENMIQKLFNKLNLKPHRQQVETYRAMMNINHELNIMEYQDPMAYTAATSSDPDTLKWHEAIKESDWEQFYEAAQTEIQTLQARYRYMGRSGAQSSTTRYKYITRHMGIQEKEIPRW